MPADMNNLTLIDHPLIMRELTLLRDKKSSNAQFRGALRRVSLLLAMHVTADLRLKKGKVDTPLETTTGHSLADTVVIVPVLRAGMGFVDGFLDILPEARVGHVGLYRNEETLQPVEYYSKFPATLAKSVVFLLDPMLATGGSGSAAIDFLKKREARRIRFVTLVAAPAGVKRLGKDHPDVPVYSCVLDRTLNKQGYILPGLGDAGDRIFGTD
jgi:uracil phosphoribosyltransferase